MEHKFRCNCPITVALDVIGDKWALVIVKQMLTEGKKTFWSATCEKAAKQIFSLIKRKKSVGYVSKRWGIAACLVKILPRWVRNRI